MTTFSNDEHFIEPSRAHAGGMRDDKLTIEKIHDLGPRQQLTPDYKYRFELLTEVSDVLSTGITIGVGYTDQYNPYTEYWSLTPNFMGALSEASEGAALTITQEGGINWSDPGIPLPGAYTTFGMPNVTIWTKMTGAPPASSSAAPAFYSNDLGIASELVPPQGELPWTGSLTWYVVSNSTEQYLLNPEIDLSSPLDKGSPPQVSGSWYFAQLTPLTWSTSAVEVTSESMLGVGSTFSSSTNQNLQNQTWLAVTRQSDAHVLVSSSDNGTDWNAPTDTNTPSDSAPALAIWADNLYLAYCAQSSSGRIDIRWSADGTSWQSSDIDTSRSSTFAPALAATTAQLYMAYTADDNTVRVVLPSDPQSLQGWSNANEYQVAENVSGAPAMTVFGDKLVLAVEGSSGTVEVYQSSDGMNWTGPVMLYPGLGNPSITAYKGLLYIACQDAQSNVWICSSPDGTIWSGYGALSAQVSTVTTNTAPALCPASSSTLVLAYLDTTSEQAKSITAV